MNLSQRMSILYALKGYDQRTTSDIGRATGFDLTTLNKALNEFALEKKVEKVRLPPEYSWRGRDKLAWRLHPEMDALIRSSATKAKA